MKRNSTLLLLLLSSFSTSLQAQIFFKEDFVYPAGPLTAAGNNWKNASGTLNQLMVTTGGLTYPGYNAAQNSLGNNKVSLIAGNTEDITGFGDANGDGSVNASDATTASPVYFSFLINVRGTTGLSVNSGTGDYFAALSPSVGNTNYTGRLFVRQGSTGGYQVGLRFNAQTGNDVVWLTGTGDNMTIGTTYLVVLRYTSVAGASNDVVDVWLNPALNGSTPAPNASVTNVSTGTDLASVGAFVLRQGGSSSAPTTPSVDVDGLSIGGTWLEAVLPLTVTSFTAGLTGSSAVLTWKSANESQLNGFYIQKSADGSNFTDLGFVKASNNPITATYTFSDNQLTDNSNYYRLKIVDLNGTVKYSSVVVISNRSFVKATVFPNPTAKYLTLTHTKAIGAAFIRVLTSDGRQVKVYNVQNGATQTGIALPEMAKGKYIVLFENKGVKTIVPFMKL